MELGLSGIHSRGFPFLLILDLWGISFHAMVVFGIGKDLLFKSALGHCGDLYFIYRDLSVRFNS